MKKTITAITVILLFLAIALFGENKVDSEEDKTEIKKVLKEAYVEGIHINRDSIAVRSGFHPDFVMQILDNGKIINATLEMWLGRLKLDGQKNSIKIEHKFGFIDVSGNAAVARMEIFEDSKQKYTDYFSLYRFEGGWKIVGKIFYSHY